MLKYIEQCSHSEIDIVNDLDFEKRYPLLNIGFVGIDFSATLGVDISRQITDSESYEIAKKVFYKRVLKEGCAQCIETCVRYLYPKYTFERAALEDIKYWQSHNNNNIILRIIELIDDIHCNPFTGGLGNTEVLKHKSGTASKRINRVDRITYTLNESWTIIHRCRSHYE